MAQNSNSEPESKPKALSSKEAEKIQKLEEERNIHKIRAEIAEYKKQEAEELRNALNAKLPLTETKGLEGNVNIQQNAGYYSEILSYEAVQICANNIADKIIKKLNNDDELIIIRQADMPEEAALWNILDLKITDRDNQLDKLIKEYENYEPTKPLEGFAEMLVGAPAILGTISEIAAFFKTDRSILTREFTLNEIALIAAVTNEIQLKSNEKKIKIYLPGHDITGKGLLIDKLNNLINSRNKLQQIRDILIKKFENEKNKLLAERKELEQTIEKAQKTRENTKELNEELIDLQLKISNLILLEPNLKEISDLIVQEIKASNDLIIGITEKSSELLSPLERVADIDKFKKHPNAKILQLNTVSQAGEILTSKSSFLNTRTYYSGGAVISYFLIETDGSLLHSGVEQQFITEKFKKKGRSL